MQTTAFLPHNFFYGVPPLAIKTGDLPLLTLYHRLPCRLPMTNASTPTRDRTATSPISPLLAFPPLASAVRRLVASHAPFTVPLLRSVLAHGAPARTAFYYTSSPLENSVAYAVPADLASMNKASPPTDRVTSHGAHANNENQYGAIVNITITNTASPPTRRAIYDATPKNVA